MQNTRRIYWLAILMFFISGAACLVYEVVWFRQFSLVLGASSLSMTIVLAVFMGGLGLGSLLLGSRADGMTSRQLARCYAALEIGIGLYALLLPVLISLAESIYVALSAHVGAGTVGATAIRMALSFGLLLVPTTMMGGTLPVLGKYLIRERERIPFTVSTLYGVNTAGAVVGVTLSGYFLLPLFGIWVSTLLAVAANVLVGAGFLLMHQKIGTNEAISEPENQRNEPTAPLTVAQVAVIVAFAVSGVAAMLYESAWTRTLSLILGTTTFSFTTMLATFLAGIALGSMLYSVIGKRIKAARCFVFLEWGAAISALITIPLFARLPFYYLHLQGLFGEHWEGIQFIRFLLAALIMLLPTLCLGLALPVVSDLFIGEVRVMGRRLGIAYAMNTLGAVAGAVLGGLVLPSLIGLQQTITTGAFLSFLAGALVLVAATRLSAVTRGIMAAAGCLAIMGICVVISPWNPKVMNSGVYVYAEKYQEILDRVEGSSSSTDKLRAMKPTALWKAAMNQLDLLYYGTGPTATVAVMENHEGTRFMTIDGKTDASTGMRHDMKTQVMIGQLPMLFHEQPDKVFVVGLGSGVTVGSVLTHDARLVDCAEMSSQVVQASRYFEEVNHKPLSDPRLRLHERDARNLLLVSNEQYDVIVSQPSNPWISGQSSLFSLEWYKIVHAHLQDGGLFVQWLPAYHMSRRDVRVITHTLHSVFPHLTVWASGSRGDVILLASKSNPLRIDYEQLLKRAEKPAVQADFARLGMDARLLPFEMFLMSEKELAVYLYGDLTQPLVPNTDDCLVTEFSTPVNMAEINTVDRFTELARLKASPEALSHILVNMPAEKLKQALPDK